MSDIRYPLPAYHPETDLISKAAELAGFKDPHEVLTLQTVDFFGRLLDIVRADTELLRLARVIAIQFGLPTGHLQIPPRLERHEYIEMQPEPTEMTEPCV